MWVASAQKYLAEGEGFEPSIPYKRYNGFQDRRLQPLGHPSGTIITQIATSLTPCSATYPALNYKGIFQRIPFSAIIIRLNETQIDTLNETKTPLKRPDSKTHRAVAQ